MELAVILFTLLCAAIVASERSRWSFLLQRGLVVTRIQNVFLATYLVSTIGDWIKGPYVYAHLERQGLSREAILVLLVASYASSGISGVIVGPTADVFGRRLLCSLFGIFAVLSVVCLHNSHFGVLLLGRVFSGLSVSILYSCFEAWVASEFFNASLKSKDLAHTFAVVTFWNGFVAVMASLISQALYENAGIGVVFASSVPFLLLSSVLSLSLLHENYGNRSAVPRKVFAEALGVLRSDVRLRVVAAQQALFEVALHLFTMHWRSMLQHGMPQEARDQVPLGLIFNCFILCIMIGSRLFMFISSGVPKTDLTGSTGHAKATQTVSISSSQLQAFSSANAAHPEVALKEQKSDGATFSRRRSASSLLAYDPHPKLTRRASSRSTFQTHTEAEEPLVDNRLQLVLRKSSSAIRTHSIADMRFRSKTSLLVYGTSALALICLCVFKAYAIRLMSCLVLEMCTGVYLPLSACVRARFTQERHRTTAAVLLRALLNFSVCVCIVLTHKWTDEGCMTLAAFLASATALSQFSVVKRVSEQKFKLV